MVNNPAIQKGKRNPYSDKIKETKQARKPQPRSIADIVFEEGQRPIEIKKGADGRSLTDKKINVFVGGLWEKALPPKSEKWAMEMIAKFLLAQKDDGKREKKEIERIIKDYGTQVGRNFLNKIAHLLKHFITMRGFTYSYDELVLSGKAEDRIRRTMRKIEKRITTLIKKYRKGTLPRLPGQSLEDS